MMELEDDADRVEHVYSDDDDEEDEFDAVDLAQSKVNDSTVVSVAAGRMEQKRRKLKQFLQKRAASLLFRHRKMPKSVCRAEI
jgi:hypothetical protein